VVIFNGLDGVRKDRNKIKTTFMYCAVLVWGMSFCIVTLCECAGGPLGKKKVYLFCVKMCWMGHYTVSDSIFGS